MREFNLKEKMDSLYESLEYYVSIPPDGSVAFEEGYHGTAIDPDGKVRNLLEEREHSLSGIKEITSYIERLNPGKLLDIGCGLGWMLSSLSQDWDKFGIEISRFASNYASKFANIHNGTLEDFKESGFDVIVMNHVIEHLEDPIAAIKKIRSLLKPSGIFIIGTPDFDSGAARRYGSNFRLLHDPTHISLFSCDSMHRCLRENGFKICNVEYPYFDTPWFTEKNLLSTLNPMGISPPFYGSAMTFFCRLST